MRANRVACVAVAGLACAAWGQAPIEYWSFDTDFSSAGTNGTGGAAVGDGVSITATPGEFLKGTGALRIDHSTSSADYVDIPTPVFPEYIDNNSPVSWTVSVWYRFDATLGANDTRNFLFETAPDDAVGVGLRSPEEDQEWFVGALATDTTGPLGGDGQWHLMTLVYDKANTGYIVFYHDGVVINTVELGIGQFFSEGPQFPRDPAVGDDSQDAGLHIGNHRDGDGSRNWQGSMDDFAIWDVALGPAQVAALFAGSFNGTPITPVNVASAVPNDLRALIDSLPRPNFQPAVDEAGWTLGRTISFPGAAGLDYLDSSDTLFAARRFQGDNRTFLGFGDGVYTIARDGTQTQIAGGQNVADVTLSPSGGSVFWVEDFAGFVYSTDVASRTTQLWADGFTPTGDVDPMQLECVPAGFDSSTFNDSSGAPIVQFGDVVVVDRGNGGFDELYAFDGSAPNLTVAVDDAGGIDFSEVLIADGLGSTDGDGIAYDPATGNNPLANPASIAIGDNEVWVGDEGRLLGGSVWRVTGPDTLARLTLSEAVRPIATILDPSTGDLLILDRGVDAVTLAPIDGASRVVRVDTTTGAVSSVISNLGGFPGDNGNAGWGALTISDDGSRLFVADNVMKSIYEFVLASCPADFNGDGTLNIFDIFGFFNEFGAGSARADFTGDGSLNIFDIFAFFGEFGAGC